MPTRRLLVALPFGAWLAGCAPTPGQQTAALTPRTGTATLRQIQGRRFDTRDIANILRASVGVLQDLGFALDESAPGSGLLTGSKERQRFAAASQQIRVTVTVLPAGNATAVRANFQIVRLDALLSDTRSGETLTDPQLYRQFFDKLSQSVFLQAHDL